MRRIYNFSAGPAILPVAVLEEASKAVLELKFYCREIGPRCIVGHAKYHHENKSFDRYAWAGPD